MSVLQGGGCGGRGIQVQADLLADLMLCQIPPSAALPDEPDSRVPVSAPREAAEGIILVRCRVSRPLYHHDGLSGSLTIRQPDSRHFHFRGGWRIPAHTDGSGFYGQAVRSWRDGTYQG
jgi:hypothetical protein